MEMMRYKTVIRFLFSTGIFFQACESDVSCRNDDGKEVDWYILYKLPNMNDGGQSYLYMDESSNGWTRSRENINSNSGTLAHTLKPLLDFYDQKTEGFGYLLYNDQPPKPKKPAPASFGHSKGVVMLDRQTGVWLSHSTPQFPTYRSKDFWPQSGNANAQTFICVTYSYATFKQIGLQLKYIHAYSYDSRITTTFPTELRCVALRTCYPKRTPWFRIMTLTSVKGQRFRSFAKYKRFGDDIYSGLIVNSVKKDLYVKSWGKIKGKKYNHLPSNCSIPHHVYNVKKVQLSSTLSWTDTVDHSKWSVTPDGGWTCIADMNRHMTQMRRGGGAICINDAVIGKAFYSLIKETEPCNRKRARAPQR
ncbi:deoxyribonuclease-2-alpha-like isoform X1 [Hippoglossus hippoglossus]|uniref:deoxyribonuclease-2-alpha-like isoform X1 n=1 Tax=Hippoglossus hippoglossus TaxID=8267 RepID=UPI00148E507F|nr:deoxyribonuclease-2-alpha-like isoform X1 [Hippoglossus hippoglossus]